MRFLNAVRMGSVLLLPTQLLIGLLVVVVLSSTVPGPVGGGLTFLPGVDLRPEPGEQHVYLVLLLAPLLLSAGLIDTVLRGERLMRSRGTNYWLLPAAAAGQALALSLIAISVHRQQDLYPYFHDWQLVVAAVSAAAVFAAVTAPRTLAVVPRTLGVLSRVTGRHWRPASSERGRRRVVARSLWFAIALVATLAFLTTTVYADGNIALAPTATWAHLPFTFDEFSAVLDGRTPLVDFTPQYTSLLPYLAAPVFAVTGLTIGAFTTTMALFSAVGLMSVFVALVRVVGRASVGALLYLPFLAMTFYPAVREGAQVHTIGAYYAMLPLRYAFPLLLTALVVAYALSANRWRSALPLGAVAGAGLINNAEFGIAALGAVVVSVFVAEATRGGAARRRQTLVAAELRVLAGVALAVVVFSLGTLMRSGSLPDFRELVYFAQHFAGSGLMMLPLPGPFGLHLVIYMTFALALVLVLSVAALGSADERRRSRLALLAYTSVFGLGAGSYYVGRSHPMVLIAIFASWALCLVVLAAEVGSCSREILAAPFSTRWLLAAPSACLAGLFVLSASALSLDSFIFEQPHRLTTQTAPKTFAAVDMEHFVADCTRPGEDVMMIYPLGHRIAYDNGVSDHFPYNHPGSVVTTRQVAAVAHQLHANRVSAVFSGALRPELVAALNEMGYRQVLVRRPGTAGLALWRPTGAPVGCR